MSMTTIHRKFSFLTAAFPHGAYQSQNINQPDLRAPSVKGQLRWWYDALFGDIRLEHGLFGHVSCRENTQLGILGNKAARVVVRVASLNRSIRPGVQFMPHKGSKGGTKNSIAAGASFEVHLIPRREGVNDGEITRLTRVLDAWLLLGAVGQRANRGAGSLWPEGAPQSVAEYIERTRLLLQGSKLQVAVLNGDFGDNETEVRNIAGNFLADAAFANCQTPFGSARPRKPSPLKLRAARLDGKLRLVALWDGRGQPPDTLKRGVERMSQEQDKRIGSLLLAALPELSA